MIRNCVLSTVVAMLCLAQGASKHLAIDKSKQESLRNYILKSLGKRAYGIYVGKGKIGWQTDHWKLGKLGNQEVAIQIVETFITITNDGEKTVLQERTKSHYSLEGDGVLLHVVERTKEDKTETVRIGIREKDQLVLTTSTKNRKTTRRVALPKETLGLMRRLDLWLEANPERGATFESYTTTLDRTNIDTKEVYKFQSKRTILWGGVSTQVYLVRVKSRGSDFDAQIRQDGKLLSGKLGGLFDIRAEKESQAKKLDGKGVDLMAASSVPVDKKLGQASRVEKLVLRAAGLGNFKLPASHRQTVRTGKNQSQVIEIRRDFRVSKPEPLAALDRARYLKATVSIQCDDEKIKKLSKRIVKTETNVVRKANRLQRWVYKNLKKSMAANASTALDVLDNKAGDCTEHSLLFVTLARAAGIPAREVGGLAYLEGRKPLFGWHAWAEIHDGHQWVTVDPTWNQVYVDATHIKFDEGHDDMSWINVVGKLKFQLIDKQVK